MADPAQVLALSGPGPSMSYRVQIVPRRKEPMWHREFDCGDLSPVRWLGDQRPLDFQERTNRRLDH